MAGHVEAVERLEATLATMKQMERFRGHFYNWYDTRDLRPLDPKYVSSVDSGNLAGHLLALGNGCRELMQKSARRSATSRRIAEIRLSSCADALAKITDTAAHADRHAEATQQCRRRDGLSARSAAHRCRRIGRRVSSSCGLAPRPWLTLRKRLAQERGDAGRFRIAHLGRCRSGLASKAMPGMRKILIPWLRLDAEQNCWIGRTLRDQAPEWMAIEPFFRCFPRWRDAPDRFDAALRELSRVASADRFQRFRRQEMMRSNGSMRWLKRIEDIRLPMPLRSFAVFLASRRRQRNCFDAMDFSFLFDDTRKLFSIGYRVTDGSLDPNCYDLLASEARLDEFHRHREGRRSFVALVPPGPRAHARGPRFRTDLLVGLDVRIPDARAGDAFAGG